MWAIESHDMAEFRIASAEDERRGVNAERDAHHTLLAAPLPHSATDFRWPTSNQTLQFHLCPPWFTIVSTNPCRSEVPEP